MAEDSAVAGDYKQLLEDFGTAVLNSQAIIARPLAAIFDLLEDDHRTYTTYHYQLEAQARVPNDDDFDRVRTQFEAALFPNFHKEMRYAALTLDNRWLASFGPFAMVLKNQMIEKRATVFEENPVHFVSRHGILLNQKLPCGYRATWQARASLAKAKCYPKLTAAMDPKEFPKILMQETGKAFEEDYVEVHIYGPFNRYAIDTVVGPSPNTREDKLLWKKLKKTVIESGSKVEEI